MLRAVFTDCSIKKKQSWKTFSKIPEFVSNGQIKYLPKGKDEANNFPSKF